jgi:putative component of toxin-antitoxin plasmid stabilization module
MGYNSFMFTVIETDEFSAWLEGLKDGMTRIRLARQVDPAARH